MITLSFLKLLENNDLGRIDEDLFWQDMTIDKVGVYIADIGDSLEKGKRKSQSFELIARGKSKIDGYKRLKKIIDFMTKTEVICEMPNYPPVFNEKYHNVSVKVTSTITTVGKDDNDRIVYSAQGQIIY